MTKIKKHYIDTDLGQIHYLATTNVELPTLVLLHQTPSSSEMYRTLMTELSDQFYCLAPDFIGFGNSDSIAPEQSHSVALYASGIEQWLNKLDQQYIVLFGHHTGAAVAAELAAYSPGVVNKLIISGPTLLPAALKQGLVTKALSYEIDEAGEFLHRYWQAITNKDSEVDRQISLRETLLALQLGDNYKQAYQAVAEHDFAACLKRINCPSLVFAGDKDVLQPFVDDTVALLPQGQKANTGNSGTYVCETHAQQVANLIREF